MQADPVIDGVTNTQGYNRYAYLQNNPLNATDPTGFSGWNKFRDKILKPVIQAVVTFYCIPCGQMLAAATTLYYGGSLGDAALAAWSTGVMANLGAAFAPGGISLGEAFTMGMVGGVLSALQGGKFGHGFVGAGLGSFLGGKIAQGTSFGDALGATGRTIARIVLGGTLSEATGGKFANGAMTAAFIMMATGNGVERNSGNGKSGNCAKTGKCIPSDFSDSERAAILKKANDLAVDLMKKGQFSSFKDAAEAIHKSSFHDYAKELGLEFYAVIDGNYNVVNVGTDFHHAGVRIPGLSGGASWHNHPGVGGDIYRGDIAVSTDKGFDWAFVSGKRLSGVDLTTYGFSVYRDENGGPVTYTKEYLSSYGIWLDEKITE